MDAWSSLSNASASSGFNWSGIFNVLPQLQRRKSSCTYRFIYYFCLQEYDTASLASACIRYTTNRVLNFTFHALFFYFLNSQREVLFHNPYLTSSIRGRQLCSLFYPVRQLNYVCRVDAEEDVQVFRQLSPSLESLQVVVPFLKSPKFSAIAWSGSSFFILTNSLFSKVDL